MDDQGEPMTLNESRLNPSGPSHDSTAAHRRAAVLEAQRDELRREVERMHPVVEAAIAWHRGTTETNPTPGRDLADAVTQFLRPT